MRFDSDLKKAGLTGNEAKVYSVLIQCLGLPAGEVAKKAGLDRSLTYTVLNNLVNKGMAYYALVDNKRSFYASDPVNLMNPLEQNLDFIKELIPKLKAITPKNEDEMQFRIFEGVEGMKAYGRLMVTQTEADSFGGTGKFYDFMLEHAPHLVGKAVNTASNGRIIASTQFGSHELNKKLGFQLRLLPAVSPATTVICPDFVGIHLMTDRPFAILIESKEVVKGFKAYFEFLWNIAKPEE
ncbi:MAG: helix-turn-helix domain-containing protein [Candidatus Woesearchaeota archaeon]